MRKFACVELLLYAIFCALILGASHRAVAQSTTVHPYRTPGAIALCGQLKTISPDSGSTIELPLLDWIASSLVRDQIPIWLDRRIPSDIELRLEIPSEQTCYAVLQSVARQIDAEVACVDRWVALVPVGFASRVEWAYWNAMTSQHTRLRTTVKNAIAWNDGTDTRQIWKSFLQSSGIPVASPSPLIDSEPDVWRAFRFEQTNAAAIATLLLSGFDQRLEYSADRPPTIESLSEAVIPTVAFQYSSEIPKIGKQAWQDWRARWQELKVDRLENSAGPNRDVWEILAPVAAHRELVDPLAPVPAPKRTVDPKQPKRFTGHYRGETRRILESLSKQLGLRFEAQGLPADLARREIDVVFQNASLDELLEKLSKASGLRISVASMKLLATPLEP